LSRNIPFHISFCSVKLIALLGKEKKNEMKKKNSEGKKFYIYLFDENEKFNEMILFF
jgi:hypothetical protein